MTTDEQIKQATEAWLLALHDAKCPEPKYHAVNMGNYWAYNEPNYIEHRNKCSGLSPRTEMFRVKCGLQVFHRCKGNLCNNVTHVASACEEHRAECNGTRPLTIAEAEALIGKMLVAFNLGVQPTLAVHERAHPWYAFQDVAYTKEYKDGFGDTPLLAILAAVASAVDIDSPC